jgi:hypothetical protein
MMRVSTIITGSGFWNPLIWVIAIIVALIIVYIIRRFGRKDYKKYTLQTKPFLSGNVAERVERLYVKGGNIYWGFTEAFKDYYERMKRIHTGDARDYVLWFLIGMTIFFAVVIGVM